MRSAIAYCLTVLLILAPIPSQAASVACMYLLMRVYHAELEHCGVALPRDQENRFQRLNAAMQKYIRDNARNDPEKMFASVEEKVKIAIKTLPSCRSNDFDLARKAIDDMTAPTNEASIRDRLKYPGDPQVGGCS